MFVETIETVAAAVTVYEKRKSIAAFLKRLSVLVLKGNKTVLVFGEGGTGKTTLGAFLSGNLDTDRGGKAYKETEVTESFRIAGELPGKLMVPPGQKDRRPGTWDQLYGIMGAGNSTAVINLVCWGFLSQGAEKERVFPGHTFNSDDEFKAKVVEDGRQRELEALRQLVPHLCAAPKPISLVTFVNKQDLWWDRRYEVSDYYKGGPYNGMVEEVRAHKGAVAFGHDIISAALIQQNLRTGDGFVIAETVSGYDDILRVANLDNAAQSLGRIMSK